MQRRDPFADAESLRSNEQSSMIPAWQLIFLLIGAYLLGSIPFGLLVGRMQGLDIRRHGSGNVGATNVGRVLGRKWGVLVLILDMSKGAAATIAAGLLTSDTAATALSGVSAASHPDALARNLIWLGTGLACVLGNVFSVFLGFRGGKGVATSLGVLLGIYPYLTLPGLVAFVLWALVVKFSGYVSLGSVCAAAFLPVGFVGMAYFADWPLNRHYPLLALLIALAALVIYRHRTNIARLLNGTESRIDRSDAS